MNLLRGNRWGNQINTKIEEEIGTSRADIKLLTSQNCLLHSRKERQEALMVTTGQ